MYPGWGQAIGWILTASSLSLIPAVLIYKLLNTTGTIKEVKTNKQTKFNYRYLYLLFNFQTWCPERHSGISWGRLEGVNSFFFHMSSVSFVV